MIHLTRQIAMLLLIGAGAQVAQDGAQAQQPRLALPVLETGGQHPMPDEWIDSDTGHRVRKLVRRDSANSSFYFTNSPFVPRRAPSGGRMVFHGATSTGRQLFAVDLQTFAIRQLTDRKGGVGGEIVAPSESAVYYRRDEPNVQFTPDGKWIVFCGNVDGMVQVYAVEVANAR